MQGIEPPINYFLSAICEVQRFPFPNLPPGTSVQEYQRIQLFRWEIAPLFAIRLSGRSFASAPAAIAGFARSC